MKRLGFTLLAFSAISSIQCAQAELRDAGDFNVGGFTVEPKLKASFGYDDNITTAPNNEISANVYKLAPELNAKTEFGDHTKLNIDLASEKGVYGGQAFNNYYDYSFGTGIAFRISNKQSLELDYSFNRSHDPAGGATSSSLTNIDKYRINKGELLYRLGNSESIARVELALRGEGKRYKDVQAKDYDTEQVDLTVYANVAPKTEVFVQAVGSEYDYITTNLQDNDDTRAYLGVQWQATAKTSGSVKIGKQEKEYTKQTPVLEQDETVWDASVTWEPKSYSAFTLSLSRDVDNGTSFNNTVAGTLDNSVDRTTTTLGWEHSWSDDLKTVVGASLANEEYLGGTRNGIEADVASFNAGLEFQVERNFTVSMDFEYTDKSADPANSTAAAIQLAEQQEYTQNTAVVFGVEIGL